MYAYLYNVHIFIHICKYFTKYLEKILNKNHIDISVDPINYSLRHKYEIQMQ